jgi:hypothetical protein
LTSTLAASPPPHTHTFLSFSFFQSFAACTQEARNVALYNEALAAQAAGHAAEAQAKYRQLLASWVVKQAQVCSRSLHYLCERVEGLAVFGMFHHSRLFIIVCIRFFATSDIRCERDEAKRPQSWE